MDRHGMEQLLMQLAQTQGQYGRVLREMERLPDHVREEFRRQMEAGGFRDLTDLLMFFER